MQNDSQAVILNVDDNDAGRYSISRILNREGFRVIEARTGEEALRLVEQSPDLVLLDVNLPDINGLELCQRMRSDARTRDIPIMHVSATAVSDHDRAAGLKSGADAYLTQPIEPDLLVATIRMLLRTRRAEAEARAAARDWQVTFDAVGHGVCLLDREGRVLRVNRAMAEMAGRSATELVGQLHCHAFEQAEAPLGGWPFDRVRASGRRETAELELNGRWFLITADPVFDERGDFAGAIRSVVEVTERRRADRERERLLTEIEQQRGRLQAVIEHLPVGVLLADAGSGEVVLANEQMMRIFREPPAVTYQRFRSLARGHKSGEWALERSIARGEVVTNEELEITRGDGARSSLLVSSAPVRDRQGFIVAGVAVFQDITDRKQLGDQLRQSQKMEAVGRLAGGVAHDFNNLLTIIGGYGQMVTDSLEPASPLRRDMESIMEAANRASALTKQLLTVSRRQVIQPKVFDLNRLISRMNRMLRRVIGEDVELITAPKAGQARIKADPGQIEQVLLNLAVNARDAMPKGGRLTLETADVEAGDELIARGLKPGRYVLLSVSDTGTGMTPEVMSHLFEPFFTTKPKGKGTGLGLSTVYGIITQIGGEILVDSEPGRGASFRMYFPANLAEAERSPESGIQPVEVARRGTETILLVEDEAEVRRLAAEMLIRQGYRVIEAASGPDAMRVWASQSDAIDLVITDVVMPKMSGHELAAQLRSSRPGLRVLYISGYTEDVVARHGVDTHTTLLQKPFTSEALARAVRAVLDSET